MNAALGWGLAVLAVAVGYAGYGWRGVALAVTVIAFWLLLQFSRSLRVLRDAAGRPVGSVASAVMLHAQLHEGMRLPQILKLTKSLGRKADASPPGSAEEAFAWSDAAGDRVLVHLREGRLARWTLERAEAPAAGAGDAAARPDGPGT
ncbi:MAG: hypothetical protein KIT17_04080 [Rubrivivax sp.]|nr:hypothetical protein [Rubrivivax sp.]